MAKLATFRDDFERATLGGDWVAGPGTPAADEVFLANGQLHVAPAFDAFWARTSSAYSAVNSAVTLEVVPLVDPPGYYTIGLQVGVFSEFPGPDNFLEMHYDPPELDLHVSKANAYTYSASVPFDPAWRWWRIGDLGGLAVFEVSTDGVTWTRVGAATHGLDLSNVALSLSTSADDTYPPVKFDHVNVHPYGATTERAYARLPETYRAADVEHDHALLRYASLVFDQASQLETLVDRAPDLADPLAADVAWLAWLGQHVGVLLNVGLTDAQKRDAVRYASSGWRAGTRVAVADAARSELLNTKFVEVYDHSTDVSARGAAGPWDVLIVTRATETPSPAAVLAAIVSKNAKPAGVKLYYRSYDTSWDTVVGYAATTVSQLVS